MGSKTENRTRTNTLAQVFQSDFDNFNLNTILRGAQLTVVGALRALHNPDLFRSEVYRQALLAVAAGFGIRLLLEIPVIVIKLLTWSVSTFASMDKIWWNEHVIHALHFITYTMLQLPYILMSLLRLLIIGPHLDSVFMTSLDWVDKTYRLKHQADKSNERRSDYYSHLKQYPVSKSTNSGGEGFGTSAKKMFIKFGTRTVFSLSAYALSFLPIVGRFILPLANFITFRNSVGMAPATLIFIFGLMLPRYHLAAFLQTYYGSRSLMRELIEPYLRRIQFTKEQQQKFFHEREGVFFGFGIGFYLLLKTPFLGVMIYGIAEASTAYLITKVTDPPPLPNAREIYAQSQTRWTSKKEFVSISLLDFGEKPTATADVDFATDHHKKQAGLQGTEH